MSRLWSLNAPPASESCYSNAENDVAVTVLPPCDANCVHDFMNLGDANFRNQHILLL